MVQGALLKNLEYKDDKVNVQLLMETSTTKEIRIVFKAGQRMNDHQAPFPIVVEVFEGQIDFGVADELYSLERGDLIALEASVVHNLLAKKDSIVRLTLSKSDSVQRVEKVS